MLGAIVVLAAGFVTAVLQWSGATLTSDPAALAHVEIAPLGGTLQQATAHDSEGRAIKLVTASGRLTPARAILTYVFPLAPFFYSWDGMVSCLRTYTPDDLRQITADLGGDYCWEVGQIDARHQFGPYKITYVIGLPQRARQQAA